MKQWSSIILTAILSIISLPTFAVSNYKNITSGVSASIYCNALRVSAYTYNHTPNPDHLHSQVQTKIIAYYLKNNATNDTYTIENIEFDDYGRPKSISTTEKTTFERKNYSSQYINYDESGTPVSATVIEEVSLYDANAIQTVDLERVEIVNVSSLTLAWPRRNVAYTHNGGELVRIVAQHTYKYDKLNWNGNYIASMTRAATTVTTEC